LPFNLIVYFLSVTVVATFCRRDLLALADRVPVPFDAEPDRGRRVRESVFDAHATVRDVVEL